jgi:hypothetical protein
MMFIAMDKNNGKIRHIPVINPTIHTTSITIPDVLSPRMNLCTPKPPTRIPQIPAATFLPAKL